MVAFGQTDLMADITALPWSQTTHDGSPLRERRTASHSTLSAPPRRERAMARPEPPGGIAVDAEDADRPLLGDLPERADVRDDNLEGGLVEGDGVRPLGGHQRVADE